MMGAVTLALAVAIAAPASPAAGPPAPGPAPAAAAGPAAGGARAQPPAEAPEWAQDAVAYLRDPRRNRRLIERFARRDPSTLHPLVQLLLADARFQAGQDRAAAALAERVAADLPDARGSSARMLLALIAFANGDAARLDELNETRARFAPPFGHAAALLGALAASARAPGEAATALERLAGDPAVGPGLRPTAQQAAGLAWLWAGDPDHATLRFDALAADRDAGVLADDARYAGAVTRWHAGARVEALDRLAALAEDAGGRRTAGVSRARLLLEREPFLRAAVGRLRRRPQRFAPPEVQVTSIVDTDAAALARRALDLLPADDPAPAAEGAMASAAADVPAPTASAAADGVPTRASDVPSQRRRSDQRGDDAARGLPWQVLVGTLVALVVVALALQAARASRRG